MGPDEYTWPSGGVNGSAYTDASAAAILTIAAELAEAAGAPPAPASWDTLAAALAPRAVPVPADSGLHGLFIAEYDGMLPNWNASKHFEKVKQADTVMLRYPYDVPMDPAIAANNLKYYAARTDIDGPAMTWQVLFTCH